MDVYGINHGGRRFDPCGLAVVVECPYRVLHQRRTTPACNCEAVMISQC
jgi:hypothetical protein